MSDWNEVDGGKTPEHGAAAGTILIVDDEETSTAALDVACSSIAEMEVAVVPSAVAAVRILSEGKTVVRAVVTDIRMPRMNGFELIEYIRADRRYAQVPIVVVSADTDPETPERSYRLGASAYFSKPCSPVAVRQTLEQLLHANRLSH